MKKIVISLIFSVLVIGIADASYYYQNGYQKSNGTYTQGHYKTRADNVKYNNRGCMEGKTSCY